MPEYRYSTEYNAPILRCPQCGEQWDQPNGITLVISVDGSLTEHGTQLDEEGVLIDVNDAVDRGYHSHTSCGGCAEMLINMDGVFENPE